MNHNRRRLSHALCIAALSATLGLAPSAHAQTTAELAAAAPIAAPRAIVATGFVHTGAVAR